MKAEIPENIKNDIKTAYDNMGFGGMNYVVGKGILI